MNKTNTPTIASSVLLCLFLILSCVSVYGEETPFLNVKDHGAVGDGVADDTAAIQWALANSAKYGGEIFIPAGIYRITETLIFEKEFGRSVIIRGQGSSPFGGAEEVRSSNTSTFLWDGEPGGTLWRSNGAFGTSWRDLNFDGGQGRKAGILLHVTTRPGWGDMLNSMSHVQFFNAKIGIQMASAPGDHTASDYSFEFVTFRRLGTAFLVKNDQGVDFLFNYVFALGCGTIFDFERGGNLLVNNAQLTSCDLFLNIRGGGRNAGTFLANNVRVERSDAGVERRSQVLKSFPKYRQAHVKFVGFTDAQWRWHDNETEERFLPLFEVGPGTSLVIESSVFNSLVARIQGEGDAAASLVTRECSYSFVRPKNAVAANEKGYYKLIHNFTTKMDPLEDVVKWPALPVETVTSDAASTPESFLSLPAPEGAVN